MSWVGRWALVCALAAHAAVAHAAERTPETLVLPIPAALEVTGGTFVVDGETPLVAAGGDAAVEVAHYFGELLFRSRGLRPAIAQPGAADLPKKVIQFSLSPAAASSSAEGYRLDVSSRGIALAATDASGLFYGAITLWQLMSAEAGIAEEIRVPAVVIDDAPRLRWRGLLLDSARQYQSVEFIKHYIDAMALHKLNVLHWRLVDDQAWRVEIPQYAKLTSGGVRFYTQAEIRDIVQHASTRHVTIVPGLEMPAHAGAAIAAYPQLGAAPNVTYYNADDATLAFLDRVLGEITRLFPAEYVHIGASEEVREGWASAPRVQARMKELGLANDARLHRYFMERVTALLAARQRKLVGWDAILGGGTDASAIVTTRKGLDGALSASGSGHDVVVSSSTSLGFEQRQTSSDEESLAPGGLLRLADVYKFDPAPLALSAQDRSRLIGVQANVWTAAMPSEQDVESMTFPRAAALAEIAWSPPARQRWSDFQERLAVLVGRYQRLGVRYSDGAFRVQAIQRGVTERRVSIELAKQVPLGEIRYTLNGSEPNAKSSTYSDVLDIEMPAVLKATAFHNGVALAHPVTMRLDKDSLALSSR